MGMGEGMGDLELMIREPEKPVLHIHTMSYVDGMDDEKAAGSRDGKDEERFKLVVEYNPIAMVLANSAGLIEMVNIAAESLFGYTRTELLGQSIDILVPDALRIHHRGLRADFAAAPRSTRG